MSDWCIATFESVGWSGRYIASIGPYEPTTAEAESKWWSGCEVKLQTAATSQPGSKKFSDYVLIYRGDCTVESFKTAYRSVHKPSFHKWAFDGESEVEDFIEIRVLGGPAA